MFMVERMSTTDMSSSGTVIKEPTKDGLLTEEELDTQDNHTEMDLNSRSDQE